MKHIHTILILAAEALALPTHASPSARILDQLSSCLLHQSSEAFTLQQKIIEQRSGFLKQQQIEDAGRSRYGLDPVSEKLTANFQELTQLGALVESVSVANHYRQRQINHFKKSLGYQDQIAHWHSFLAKIETDGKKMDAYASVLKKIGIESSVTSCRPETLND